MNSTDSLVEPADALVVEDDQGDALMIQEAFDLYNTPNRIHIVLTQMGRWNRPRRDGRARA